MSSRKKLLLALLLPATVLGIFFYFRGANRPESEITNPAPIPTSLPSIANSPSPTPQESFCGSSSYGSCSSDADCKTGGCSGQVCQAKNEEGAITTCEWKDCYDSAKYGLQCQCVNKQCQWQK